MSQIIKAFTGIFIVMFMMVSATGILGTFLQTLHAQNLHAAIINELENSDYARTVLIEVFDTAEEGGYELRLRLYQEYEEYILCAAAEEVPEDVSSVMMAEVTLSYPVQLLFFQVSQKQDIVGYAR